MFYIVETQDQLSQLLPQKSCYINVIPLSSNYHPILTEVSLIYYKPKHGKGLILTINHSEGFYLSLDKVKEFLLKHKSIYVLDKKTTAHLIGEEFLGEHVLDINLLSLSTTPITPYIQDCNTNIHTHFERLYEDKPYLNSIIPISKHYETQGKIYEKIVGLLNLNYYNSYYNHEYVRVFHDIEKQGIALNMPVFSENFKPKNAKFNIKDDKIYTQYNLYNFTSRPSNSFNGINFAALNKHNGQRASFIPQNDYLFEFDYDSYHPRILAKLIGYKFEEASVHTHLGQMYFKTNTLTEEQYQQSKELTFKQLYGGVFEQYKDIPYFKLVKEFTDSLWEKYNKDGYIELIGGKRKLYNIENATPQKLLNYIIQSGETFYNVMSIKKVLEYLESKKSNIILYTYDSILIDYSKEDGKETLKDIKDILESSFGFKINASYGTDYNNLTKI
jgi:uncharacterized protein YcgL (UPF0745 family)